MAGFQYYAPGRQRLLTTAEAIRQALDALELRYLSGAGVQSRVVMATGPDGGAGLILALGNVDRLGYYADSQEWARRPDGQVWLGWERDVAPGPSDLARDQQLQSLGLRLGDGNVWQIPLAQHWDGQSYLPSIYRLSNGEIVSETVPALRAFQGEVTELLNEWKAALEGGRAPSYPEESLFALAGHALELNYRMGQWEALALGLLQTSRFEDRAGVWDVCTATFNWPAVEAGLRELSKKNGLEGPGDSGGGD